MRQPRARREIVERAYAVFHRYRRKLAPATMHWSIEEPEIRVMQNRVKETPLRSLDPHTLRSVLMNASADERSLKHFLPRALDCIDSGSSHFSDLAFRLQPEAIREWPEDEAGVLHDFLKADPNQAEAQTLRLACEARLHSSR